MESLREKMLKAVDNGARFKIDFGKRSLKLNNKSIVKDGKYDGELTNEHWNNVDEFLADFEKKYYVYKHSVPGKRRYNNSYFSALPLKELNDDEFDFGTSREITRFDLEFTLLAAMINGEFKWKDDWGWFWQSDVEKDLVILKQWCENVA